MRKLHVALWVVVGLGCRREAEPVTVVWFTADTLGATAAREAGTCERLAALVADYGLELACLDGAVPPAPWTLESHVRTLWPDHLAGDLARRRSPSCDSRSVLAEIADRHDGDVVVGLDNPMFTKRIDNDEWCGAELPWARGAAASFTIGELDGSLAEADIAEADRPVHLAIDAILGRVAEGDSVAALLNAYEPGGHQPRCWFAPDTEACAALWDLAIDAGIATAADDPTELFREEGFKDKLIDAASEVLADDPERVRWMFWQSMLEAIEHWRGEMLEERLRRLLDGLRDADRLGTLTLIVTSDHGENPCVVEPVTGNGNCAHIGMPTEFTANVPVYVAPATAAEAWRDAGLVGDAAAPWSLANLAWGLAGHEVPGDWPEPEPVGVATAWECDFRRAGLRVDGDVALRCSGDACEATTWGVPTDRDDAMAALDEVPDALVGYDDDGDGNFVADRCGGPR